MAEVLPVKIALTGRLPSFFIENKDVPFGVRPALEDIGGSTP
jgi:hypothetical protein